MATDPKGDVREAKLSSNRQIGLPADFARALGAKPGSRLVEVLVRLPGIGHGVLLFPKTADHAKGLRQTLAGAAPEGADTYVRKLRAEWRKRAR